MTPNILDLIPILGFDFWGGPWALNFTEAGNFRLVNTVFTNDLPVYNGLEQVRFLFTGEKVGAFEGLEDIRHLFGQPYVFSRGLEPGSCSLLNYLNDLPACSSRTCQVADVWFNDNSSIGSADSLLGVNYSSSQLGSISPNLLGSLDTVYSNIHNITPLSSHATESGIASVPPSGVNNAVGAEVLSNRLANLLNNHTNTTSSSAYASGRSTSSTVANFSSNTSIDTFARDLMDSNRNLGSCKIRSCCTLL